LEIGMIVRRICYVLLLAAGGFFAMLYDFQGLRLLLCWIVLFPFLGLLFLLPKVSLCRVGMEAPQVFVTRGETIRVKLIVENRGFFPVSCVLVALRWSAPGEKEYTVRKWLRGFGRGCEEIELELSASHCGAAQLGITKARVCDYLGLFSLPVKGRRSLEFCITPVVTPISQEEMLYPLVGTAGERDGDLFLRDYQPGDSLQRVYWKLSARVGELQVRELEQNGSLTLYLCVSEEFRKKAEAWDEYLGKACSLLWFLAQASAVRVKPNVVWEQEGSFQKYEICGVEDLQAWMYALLTGKGLGQPMGLELPIREEEVLFLKDGCHLDEDGRLYIGEQCVYE